jgi:hypothetical protein
VFDARLLIKEKDDNYRQGIRSLAPICLSLIYYTCGLIVIFRYHHLGIYVVRLFLNICFNAKHYSIDSSLG